MLTFRVIIWLQARCQHMENITHGDSCDFQ